jgi:hypothetical protein
MTYDLGVTGPTGSPSRACLDATATRTRLKSNDLAVYTSRCSADPGPQIHILAALGRQCTSNPHRPIHRWNLISISTIRTILLHGSGSGPPGARSSPFQEVLPQSRHLFRIPRRGTRILLLLIHNLRLGGVMGHVRVLIRRRDFPLLPIRIPSLKMARSTPLKDSDIAARRKTEVKICTRMKTRVRELNAQQPPRVNGVGGIGCSLSLRV